MTAAPASSEQLGLLPAERPTIRSAELPIDRLTGWENAQPRHELVELVARLGVLEPIVVPDVESGPYPVVEGRRRVRAAALAAERAGASACPVVPAVIVSGAGTRPASVRAALTLALHASRSASPASELEAIEELLSAGGEEAATVKRIAEETGMPVQTVRRRLRLRALSPVLRAAFEAGELTASVAEAAAKLTAAQQRELERRLEAGERVTSGAVRDIARQRTAQAVAQLDASVFGQGETSWRATVRGHLRAALEAIAPAEQDQALAQLVQEALDSAERESAAR